MRKFNQAEFESKAKKLVVRCSDYEVDEKDVSIVWFSNVGANAKAMLSSAIDNCYFEVTYFVEEGKYIVDEYDFAGYDEFHEDEEEL